MLISDKFPINLQLELKGKIMHFCLVYPLTKEWKGVRIRDSLLPHFSPIGVLNQEISDQNQCYKMSGFLKMKSPFYSVEHWIRKEVNKRHFCEVQRYNKASILQTQYEVGGLNIKVVWGIAAVFNTGWTLESPGGAFRNTEAWALPQNN